MINLINFLLFFLNSLFASCIFFLMIPKRPFCVSHLNIIIRFKSFFFLSLKLRLIKLWSNTCNTSIAYFYALLMTLTFFIVAFLNSHFKFYLKLYIYKIPWAKNFLILVKLENNNLRKYKL